jgi:hypothetical protein
MRRCAVCMLLRPAHVSINSCNKPEAAGDELLRLAWRWLTCHEAIGDLLMVEEPLQVAQVRMTPQMFACGKAC